MRGASAQTKANELDFSPFFVPGMATFPAGMVFARLFNIVSPPIQGFIQLLKTLLFILLLALFALPAAACFGPKLYIGTPAGEEGELLFHLASIYIHEKTGVDSTRFEMTDEQSAEAVLQREEVDLVFSHSAVATRKALLQIGAELWLLSGPRPTDDLQFTTVPRTLKKLQRLLTTEDLSALQRQVASGVLPATAIRKLYMERNWI